MTSGYFYSPLYFLNIGTVLQQWKMTLNTYTRTQQRSIMRTDEHPKSRLMDPFTLPDLCYMLYFQTLHPMWQCDSQSSDSLSGLVYGAVQHPHTSKAMCLLALPVFAPSWAVSKLCPFVSYTHTLASLIVHPGIDSGLTTTLYPR